MNGVSVVDGRLAFEDLDALTDAIEKLADFNQESILAWSEKIGFTSLFTERERLKFLSADEINAAINSGLYTKYFTINKEYGDLELVMHHPIIAIFYNLEGIIQVGDYVGIISNGLNVWTKPENKDKLVQAIDDRQIVNESDFIIINKEYFEDTAETRDWTERDYNCPRDAYTDWGWSAKKKNPNHNRRIRIRPVFMVLQTPVGNNLFNYFAAYMMESLSYKSSNNAYKTDHYMSLDFDYVPFNRIGQYQLNLYNTETDTRTKKGTIIRGIYSYGSVPQSFLINNGIRLVETNRGVDGYPNGSAASHRGMGALYIRHQCD